jgi:hypothetical protein
MKDRNVTAAELPRLSTLVFSTVSGGAAARRRRVIEICDANS